MFPGETILSQPEGLKGKDPHYSDFRVLYTPAGWYVGTVFTACAAETCSHDCSKDYHYLPPEQRITCQEPGTRETDYFKSWGEAKAALDTFNGVGVMIGQRT